MTAAAESPAEGASGIPDALPAGFEAYGRSPDFTPANLPAKLQAAHTTKAGTWGLLTVLEGSVRYQLEPPYRGERLVGAGEHVVIESQVPHHVAFVAPGRFFVAFSRLAPA
jgi:hemoglobin